MRGLVIALMLLVPSGVFAQADVSFVRGAKITTQVFKIRQATDLGVSALPGFLQVSAGADPQQDSAHFSTRDIVLVTTKRDGVQIRFSPKPVADPPGLQEILIVVPLDVLPQARALELVKTALERVR